MKNFTLLLVLLLVPFFGFSQTTELLKWNGRIVNWQATALPTFINGTSDNGATSSTIEADPVTGNNINFESLGYNGFKGTGWNEGSTPDDSKYFLLKVKAKSSTQLNLERIDLTYRGNFKSMKVSYSKSETFASPTSIVINDLSIYNNPYSKTVSLTGSNSIIGAGETLYIRIYAFNKEAGQENKFQLEANPDNNAYGIKVFGSVNNVVTCAPPANSDVSGTNAWNGYVFTYTGNTPAKTTYIGTVNESSVFDINFDNGAVRGQQGTNIPCVTAPSDRFLVRYKMKLTNLPVGKYNFTVGGDDGYRLYIDDMTTPVINNWADHGYEQSTAQKTFTSVANHELVFEYYEKEGGARAMFSYGLVQGDNSYPFGNKVWNVYAFTESNLDAPVANSTTFAGSYVDNNVNINTENFWNAEASPSSASGYIGAKVPRDYFTTVFKRQGFPCGNYTINVEKWDDDYRIYVDGVQKATAVGNSSDQNVAGTFKLGATSTIEVRLKENAGAAVLKLNLIDNPTIYSATSTPSAASVVGTSIRIDSNTNITGKLDVCSCEVSAGVLLTVKENAVLNVQDNVVVKTGGKIVVENNGSLVQVNNTATYTGNATSFEMIRKTAPMQNFDFTYWSSPLSTESNNTIGYKLNQLSPTYSATQGGTLADKYLGFNPNVNNWMTYMNGDKVMVPGEGYLVRAPQGWSTTNATAGVYTANFVGRPNTGTITYTVAGTSNLIGNPYPSSISADQLAKDNEGVINGTFYFWSHNSRPNSATTGNATYNYSPDDYATYNRTGGVASRPANNAQGVNKNTPNGNITAGQSFFVEAKAPGAFVFKNSQRVTDASSNSQFFRNGQPLEKSRFWMNITNEAGAFNEMLVGYITDATNDFDSAFDGVSYSSGNAMIYTVQGGNQLAIQGRALPFSTADVVQVGLKVAAAGQFTINMDEFDGLFTSQNIYLVDKLTNTTHNLKSGNYTFNSAAGTFENRFEIKYVDTTLGIDVPVVSDKDIIVYNSGNQIGVRATNYTIKNVDVYDITGKVIYTKKAVNNSQFSTSGLNINAQVVVIKITLDDNQIVSKKVMMN